MKNSRAVKILTVVAVAYVGISLGAYLYPCLARNSGSVLSLEPPFEERSFLTDFVTRAPIVALSLISERWQANLGLDIFLKEFTTGLTSEERGHIRSSVASLYDEMSALPAWRSLPSVTGYSAFDLFDIYPQRAHAYVYVPKSLKGLMGIDNEFVGRTAKLMRADGRKPYLGIELRGKNGMPTFLSFTFRGSPASVVENGIPVT